MQLFLSPFTLRSHMSSVATASQSSGAPTPAETAGPAAVKRRLPEDADSYLPDATACSSSDASRGIGGSGRCCRCLSWKVLGTDCLAGYRRCRVKICPAPRKFGVNRAAASEYFCRAVLGQTLASHKHIRKIKTKIKKKKNNKKLK